MAILVVGLGNVGREYEQTRHNVGFRLVDAMASNLHLSFKAGRGAFDVAEGKIKQNKIVLIKPTTYMNLSGTAVRKALSVYSGQVSDCLVCYDDLNLPFGTLRFRAKGSAGGHNGIKHIISTLQTDEFPRLRIGIGADFPRGGQVDFVLSNFSNDEEIALDGVLKKGMEAVSCFAQAGITIAMNEFN